MTEPTVRQKVLMTVLTYPHPSEKYNELICTAGITQDGRWIRLYPIDSLSTPCRFPVDSPRRIRTEVK